jgi:hypothetical protein
MHYLITAYAAVAARWTELTDVHNRDRGESPVSTAVIIGGIALAAVALVATITAVAKAWGDKIPK